MTTPNNQTGPTGGHGWGTLPVFLAGISTILGAIMFLRFGYAVGHTGLAGVLLIILLGHLVTIPTALAIAEIATNRKVEGGGEYFIISRSFGTTIGSVIGISLYLSQAVSVAFYMIAFAEAFSPLEGWFNSMLPGIAYDPRMISIPALILLLGLMLTKGADLGVKALYVVVAMLAVSLALFFAGTMDGFELERLPFSSEFSPKDPFFMVFAICFPAFTGMTAGVGLSGDLANPRKSIPRGTLMATFGGMIMYILIVVKLAMSAPIDELATDQLIMSKIALWGPIIPIGLGFATLSSAIGSILVAPRTLQALGGDQVTPMKAANRWLSKGVGSANEPRNATILSGLVALIVVMAGNVDFVASLISMFFMVTYGALCLISFLEHFAARPSYRPSFRSRWYISLFGAIMCVLMMFQMDPVFALLAIMVMVLLYLAISRAHRDRPNDLAAMFLGVFTQLTRKINVKLQPNKGLEDASDWRPSIIMVNDRSFDRRSHHQMLRWLSNRYGFGTYLHLIKDQLDVRSYREGKIIKDKLVKMAQEQNSSVYMGTIVSPSMRSALAQSLQLPGVSGLSNNCVMFEFSNHDQAEVRQEVAESSQFAASTRQTLLVLRHGDNHFGAKKSIDIWLTWNDQENANVMILLGYMILGNKDWAKANMRIFAALPSDQVAERRAEIQSLIKEGRLPVSEKNVSFLDLNNVQAFREAVKQNSESTDLCIIGFNLKGLRERGDDVFLNHPDLKDVLFVHAPREVAIE